MRNTTAALSFVTTFGVLAALLIAASGQKSVPAVVPLAATTTGSIANVTWVPADAPLFTGAEAPNPFAAGSPDTLPGEARWQLLVGEVGGTPRNLYESPRRFLSPTWSVDGRRLSIRYASAAAIAPNGPNIVAGILSFDARNLGVAPADVSVQVGALEGVFAFNPSPDGRKVVVVRPTSPPPGPGDIPPGMGFRRDTELLLVDVQARAAQKLTGLPGRISPASGSTWSPDGRFFIAVSISGPAVVPLSGPSSVDLLLVPTSNGPARPIASVEHVYAAWSPTAPYRLAYVDSQGALWLFDPRTGANRQLASPEAGAQSKRDPVWVSPNLIQLGSRAVDLRSGAEVTYVQPAQTELPAVSPDGRYLAAAERVNDRSSPPGTCPWTGVFENRVYLHDSTTGGTRLLKDCDGRALVQPGWLADSRHVVLMFAECYQCGPERVGRVLKDIVTGQETPLTDGLEAQAWAVPAPDGKKLLVTGDRLRIYGSDGRLLQDIASPAGTKVVAAAWAPDNRRYAYVAVPTQVRGFE